MLTSDALNETLATIERAFAGVEYPGDNAITLDPANNDLERRQIAACFSGKHWRDLGIDFLIREKQSIIFMTPQAHAFYLPAYMIVGLTKFYAGGADPAHTALTNLDPTLRTKEEFEELIAPLTLAQRHAVAVFLDFLRRYHPKDYPDNAPGAALGAYWERFLTHVPS